MVKTKVTWVIDKDIVKRTRHKAVELEKSTSSLVEQALKIYLPKRRGG